MDERCCVRNHSYSLTNNFFDIIRDIFEYKYEEL